MADLTPAEKEAGRAFLTERAAALAARPAVDMLVPPYIPHHMRHLCPKLGKSVSFELKEDYSESPGYEGVPAGRFAWVYREGKCPDCGLSARDEGRLVDARVRPPLGRS